MKKDNGVRKTITAKLKTTKSFFGGAAKRLKHPRKKTKKVTKIERENAKNQRNRAIMGIGLLFVIVSIIYSTTVTRYFVSSNVSLLALAPQVIFAFYTLLKAFSKLYK